jgi:acetyltransferase-like isoleucine patch superfamily enzyme
MLFDKFFAYHEKVKLQKNLIQVKIGCNSKLYPECRVINYSNQKDLIEIGENSHIRGDLVIFNYGGKIVIGNNSFLGEGSKIWSDNKIVIGNNVMISHNVNIIDTNSHETNYLERNKSFKYLIEHGYFRENRSYIKSAPIIIEDNVWINLNAIILRGVRIGRGSIIGAGSIITKDIPEFTFWAGSPAKFISKVQSNCDEKNS